MASKTIKKMIGPERFEAEEVFMIATSTDPDPHGGTRMVLYWKPAPNVIGYNLYRSDYKRGPINGDSPIAQVNTCTKLKTYVPEGSKAWKILTKGFSSLASRRSLKIVPDTLHRGRMVDASGLLMSRYLAPGTGMESLPPAMMLAGVNPCDAVQRGLTQEEQALFDSLAGVNLAIRQARGWAFIDSKVVTNTTYVYELRGVLADGKEIVLDTNVIIKAGAIRLPQPPKGFTLQAGDGQILAYWNRNDFAASYTMERSCPPSAYQCIHDSPIVYDITHDLFNQKIGEHHPGFVDFQRFNDEGLPVSHSVGGVDVDGPVNGTTYQYRVASCDILERRGSWSIPQSAIPVDITPPMTPTDFRVDVSSNGMSLILTWRKVTRDVKNHQILESMQSYRIYRAEQLGDLEDPNTLAAYQVATVNANPTDPATVTVSWMDSDPALHASYGEKDVWYRIVCRDSHGNASDPSAALAGRLPDLTPPGPTRVVGAEGYADHISVTWLPNPEPDLAGYQIYRGVCDQGKPYRPPGLDQKEQFPCDFVLVGEVRYKDAEEMLAANGQIMFDDTSVPAGSPLCYAYWVRAFDASGNLYAGDLGCPTEELGSGLYPEYVCQRLYEETPPPVPIMAALKARNGAVLLEWIASPIQDLRAFHIYRSEDENGPLDFIGCVLKDGTIHAGPWTGERPDCSEIPAEADPASIHGTFLDTTVKPNQVYWYRISALDWLGNESEAADLSQIPAVSTFTYSRDLPASPGILAQSGASQAGCGLVVKWTPAYDATQCKGFLVFRSRMAGSGFRQVSSLVQDSQFEDRSARHGVDYWYQVQAMRPDGTLSAPSVSALYRY